MPTPEVTGKVVSPEGSQGRAAMPGSRTQRLGPKQGEVVDTKSLLPTTLPLTAAEIALIVILVVVAGYVLLVSYLVVRGDLNQIYLTAVIADSEAGLVLVTIYLLVIELRRDRRASEK